MSGGHYLALTEAERREMMAAISIDSPDQLFADIPTKLRYRGAMDLPPALSESEAASHLCGLAAKNANLKEYVSFLGGGIYDHFIPSVVGHVTGRSEFYTSYTPYQAEISQGLLQAIFEYQTMICQLTGMDVANASMYDGATSLAEAAVMACAVTRRSRILVSRSVNPVYRQVLQTYFEARDLGLAEAPLAGGVTDLARAADLLDDQTAAMLIQTPNFFGALEETAGLAELLHQRGALLVVAVDPLSLPLLQAPSEYGADLVVGEGQGLGNPPSFGGPLLGFFAAREEYARRMPGRIVGETLDLEGNRGFVLTLQTREQHIRRERATSNICSNQSLNALAAAVYLAALGPAGMKEVAGLCLQKAAYAREQIMALPGYQPAFDGYFFKEFPVLIPGDPGDLNRLLLARMIIGGLDLGRFYPEMNNTILLSFTENRTREEIDRLVNTLEEWQ